MYIIMTIDDHVHCNLNEMIYIIIPVDTREHTYIPYGSVYLRRIIYLISLWFENHDKCI